MVENHRNRHGKYFLTMVFVSILLFSFGNVVQNVFADTVVSQIGMSGAPQSIGVNPNTNKIYIGYYNNNTVSVINGITNTIVNTIPVGFSVSGIGVNPNTNKIYVAGGNTVSVIDGVTDTIIATIKVSAYNVAVNPNTNKIYVAGGNTVSVIDGSTNIVLPVIGGFCLYYCESITLNPNTNKVYAVNHGGYRNEGFSVFVIDGISNAVTAQIPVYGWHLTVNPNTNKIYAANGGLIVIDGATNAFTSVPVAASCVEVNPNTDKIYACDSGSTYKVNVIDGTTYDVISAFSFTTPTDLGINLNTNRVYVTDFSANQIDVIDGNTSYLTTSTQLTNGTMISGMNVTLFQNGVTVYTGFSPSTFILKNNQLYSVQVQDSAKYIFDRWSDTNSTNTTREISIPSDTAITAVYRISP